ncbi:MAG: ATP synthase F1 subunit gamma [Cytophagales bacterium]|nr:MAG: ATP synthase F1 subunit gamma [Cytophagales bacterium]
MPSLKEVRSRIRSVQSTQQITKAMKMVAAAKLRKAQEATIQLRPYSSKLNEVLSNLTTNEEILAENPYTKVREVKNVLLVVLTSDRGLCGPFNTNIMKATNALITEKYDDINKSGNLDLLCVGRKSNEYYAKRNANINSDFATLLQKMTFDTVKVAAETVMAQFVSGKYDVVEIIFNEFKNVATQIVRTEQFLPVVPQVSTEKKVSTDYIFEPSVDFIVNDLVPKSLKIKFYKSLLESNASEHGARMSAMDKATENAGEMLKDLKVTYNRSRQASITKEILEIVGGAEALAAK